MAIVVNDRLRVELLRLQDETGIPVWAQTYGRPDDAIPRSFDARQIHYQPLLKRRRRSSCCGGRGATAYAETESC
jgi:hypothetical protein